MNKKFIYSIATTCFLIATSACGPSRFVSPLKKGEQAISASLGGPIVNVPGIAPIPIPLTSITYGRGLKESLTVYGSWHTTAAVFGTIQLDAGITKRIWRDVDNNKGISVSPGFNTAMDIFDYNFKFWPTFDANYYWKYNVKTQNQEDVVLGRKHIPNMMYFGFGSWFELQSTRAHGETQQTRLLPMFHFGHDKNWNKWTFRSEIKLLAPFTSNENIVVDYISLLGNNGATGIYFGITKRF